MAILNSDCRLNAVLLISGVLAQLGPTPKKELVERCMPGVENDSNERILGTINAFNDVLNGAGLFQESKERDSTISFAEEYEDVSGWSDWERLEKFPEILRSVIFKNTAKKDFMSSNSGTNDINRVFAWLLAQNVYTASLSNAPLFDLEKNQIRESEKRVLDDNTARTPNMREWGVFLGFIGQSDDGEIIDPTGAIRDSIPNIFGEENELEATEFIDLLKNRLPVLDGGKYRKIVEKSLDPAVWEKPKDGFLSTSLSRALWRLDKDPSAKFVLDDRSDAGSIGLELPPDGSPTRFSHVRKTS